MNKTTFGNIAKDIRPSLIDIAIRLLGDADEAEDIVQDALLRVWMTIDDSHNNDSSSKSVNISGFAKVVVHNLCIDFIRKQKEIICIDNVEIADYIHPETCKEAIIKDMMDCICQLPTAQQTVLRLRHIEGMEMKEIAALLGTSEQAIRQSLSRARRKLLLQITKGGISL